MQIKGVLDFFSYTAAVGAVLTLVASMAIKVHAHRFVDNSLHLRTAKYLDLASVSLWAIAALSIGLAGLL